jgi:hypothetical protein
MKNKASPIEELQRVIRHLHGATATHRESVPVKETFRGETVWEGIVEVFHLKDHPATDTAYGWLHDPGDGKPAQHVTVLHLPPATSPLAAVRTFLVQEFRNAQTA